MTRGSGDEGEQTSRTGTLFPAIVPRPQGRSRCGGKRNQHIKFGAWNMRTMLQRLKLKQGGIEVTGGGLGKEELLCRELERKQINLTAISEHRWHGQGEFRHGDYLYLYTGADEADIPNPAHRSGVAIILDEELQKAWRKPGSEVEYKTNAA